MEDESQFEKKRKRNASGESTFSNDSVSNYIPTPPDGGWGWVIVFASFINHVIVDGITFSFGVFYMTFVDEFQESRGKTALVGSLLAGFYLMSGPISSALVNRYGCRAVCVAGAIIASAAFVFATLSKSIDVLMVTYGVMGGFGFGLVYLPSIISVSYYFEKKRALATGIAVCGAGVGQFVFAPTGRLLLERFDWKNSLYIVAGITINAAVMGALMRPLETPRKKPRRKNFFDRLREQTKNRNRSASTDTNTFYGVQDRDNIAQLVQEAKEAREQKLRDEEGDSEFGSFPNSVVNSLRNLKGDSTASTRNNSLVTGNRPVSQGASRKNSALPATPEGVVAPLLLHQDAELEDDVSGYQDDPESQPSSRRTSHKTAIPSHVRKEIEKNHKNNLACGAVLTNPSGPPAQKNLLKPVSGQQSLSVSDVMAFNPRRRSHIRAPVGASKEDYARPLYRRDIFYSGSILHIPNFRSQPDVKMYVASITTIPNDVPPEKESRVWRCLPIPKTAKDVLKDMLDLSLLKDPVFLIACLGEVFGFIGLYIPFVYVTQRAVSMGVSETKASFLLSVIGITNTLGRVVSGFLADFPRVNSLLLHNVMMILGGVACCLDALATTYATMIVFCAFFGLCVATYISLTSIILCNLMGLEKLTSAFGFLTLVRGLASIAGPPVAGMVYDATNDYDMSFHVGGVMFILAGGFYCLLHLPMFSRNMIQKVIDEHLEETITEVTITPDVKIEVQSPEESLLPAQEEVEPHAAPAEPDSTLAARNSLA